ncbi:MAG TPA: hypothetical protein VHS99_19625, partial [Chloroflexota bacterium]|nr:hypothetical protein [Chloroflexota bacterium]
EPRAPSSESTPESTPTSALGSRDWGRPPSGGPVRWLYAVLVGLPLILALARLGTGPWFHLSNPSGVRLLEGWPAGYEVAYYLAHFPTFLGSEPPQYAFSAVHYRSFLELYAVSAIYAWTGSAYWSFAAVDLLGWVLAGVAGYHLALRLGAACWGAALGSLLLTASPLLVSNMWIHVLHLAEFATLPLGLWAALVLVDDAPRRARGYLAAALGLVLLFLSLTYQYQWIMVPLVAVLLGARRDYRWRDRGLILAGAILHFAGATAALRLILGAVASSGEADIYTRAVAQPVALAAVRLAEVLEGGRLTALFPGWSELRMMVEAYHPLVFGAGLLGLVFLPWRTRLLALVATGATLGATSLYPAPWTAMSAYPFIYAGAGVACAGAGRWAGRAIGTLPWPARPAVRLGMREGTLEGAIGVGLALVLFAVTNTDLAGDPAFLLRWWDLFSPHHLS